MRVLHVVKKYPGLIGGDATAVAALAREQSKAGHDVVVVSSNAREVDAGPSIFRIGPEQSAADLDRITWARVATVRAVRRWCNRELATGRIDAVHAHSPDLGFAAASPARRRGVPIVDTCHGLWFPFHGAWSLRGRLELTLLRWAQFDAITTVDRPAMEALRSRGFPSVSHIPNGVDVDEFSGPRIEPERTRFLFAGRHERQKGLDVLLAATADLRRVLGARFGVTVLGHGSLTPALRQQARALGLGDVVEFPGAVNRPDLVRAYHAASVFVLPSRFEGFPIAILEAWASGLPVIATRVGGVEDLCSDENALLVSPGEPSALAQAMERLAREPDLARRLGAAGHRLVRDRFGWGALAQRYVNLYETARDRRQVRA